jgi:hypothetical protein
MARTPAPAKVLSELAPPVELADAALDEREADPDSDEEREVDAESEALAVPVDVTVVNDPLEEIVEVTVEAATRKKVD